MYFVLKFKFPVRSNYPSLECLIRLKNSSLWQRLNSFDTYETNVCHTQYNAINPDSVKLISCYKCWIDFLGQCWIDFLWQMLNWFLGENVKLISCDKCWIDFLGQMLNRFLGTMLNWFLGTNVGIDFLGQMLNWFLGTNVEVISWDKFWIDFLGQMLNWFPGTNVELVSWDKCWIDFLGKMFVFQYHYSFNRSKYVHLLIAPMKGFITLIG